MSQDLLSFMGTVESRLREKLKQTGASGSSSEEFVTGFMKGFSKSASIQRRIRMTDATMAKALIAMTDLVEAQWGKWKVENAKMVFNDPAAAKRYTELVGEIMKAADEQSVAQRELIELQQRK